MVQAPGGGRREEHSSAAAAPARAREATFCMPSGHAHAVSVSLFQSLSLSISVYHSPSLCVIVLCVSSLRFSAAPAAAQRIPPNLLSCPPDVACCRRIRGDKNSVCIVTAFYLVDDLRQIEINAPRPFSVISRCYIRVTHYVGDFAGRPLRGLNR